MKNEFYGVGFINKGEEKNKNNNIFTKNGTIMGVDTFCYADILQFKSRKEAEKFAKDKQQKSHNNNKIFVIYKY